MSSNKQRVYEEMLDALKDALEEIHHPGAFRYSTVGQGGVDIATHIERAISRGEQHALEY